MPKQTFWNLPTEKREALVSIARDEFAANDYTSASISQIVARAQIAKGSLYQYFEDKQDLFLYLLDDAQQTLLEALKTIAAPHQEPNFFALLRSQMQASIEAALRYPLQAQLLQRAYTAQLPFREMIMQRAAAVQQQHMHTLVDQAIARGEIVSGLRPAVITMMIAAVVGQLGPFLLAQLGLDPQHSAPVDPAIFQTSEVDQIFAEVIMIFEQGLGKKTHSG